MTTTILKRVRMGAGIGAALLVVACGSQAPGGGDTGTGGAGGPQQDTNVCTLAFPTTDLCTQAMGEEKGEVLTANATETALVAYLNEVRTRGTLDGLTYHKVAGEAYPIFPNNDTSCRPGFTGGLKLVTFEGHIHYVARKHSEYLTINKLVAGENETHDEDSTLPGFRGKYIIDRYKVSGIPTNNAGGGEVVISGHNSKDPRKTAYQAIFAFMRSKGHCQSLMYDKTVYFAPGVVRKSIDETSDWVSITINTWDN
ncbi:hypothetical protein [Deinococcus yunweiensis]|uniref:hypothetical protein n=1 Tax=Deinococcus yunweiensis TaxID=367282 RepID=UPI00398F2F9E